MAIQVRHLSENEIEQDTELLLAEYKATAGEPIKLPIPIDEITIYHLALRLEFADLHKVLRVPMLREQPDILGAILIDRDLVLIDQSLDPSVDPSMKGRYRFSVGHEVGHFRLHRSYVTTDADQTSFFDAPSESNIICRTSQANERVERQADIYASCLLMPRETVFRSWEALPFGQIRGLAPNSLNNPVVRKEIQNAIRDRGEIWPENMIGPQMFDWAIRRLAENFAVSNQAMRIRLEKLGVLCQKVPQQRRLAG